MHEISIVENVVKTTEEYAREQGAEKVKFITMRVGLATGVVPKYLHMYYPEVCEGTLLEGSELKGEEVPLEVFCKNCGEVFEPSKTGDVCPECFMKEYEVLHGEELVIKEIGFI